MLQRINVREKIVGFYSTGPRIKPADLDIADLVSGYCKKPVFAIIDIRAQREEEGLPVKAYTTVEKARVFFFFVCHLPAHPPACPPLVARRLFVRS